MLWLVLVAGMAGLVAVSVNGQIAAEREAETRQTLGREYVL